MNLLQLVAASVCLVSACSYSVGVNDVNNTEPTTQSFPNRDVSSEVSAIATIANIETTDKGCRPNGLIAHDKQGNLLSCESGKWAMAVLASPEIFAPKQ